MVGVGSNPTALSILCIRELVYRPGGVQVSNGDRIRPVERSPTLMKDRDAMTYLFKLASIELS